MPRRACASLLLECHAMAPCGTCRSCSLPLPPAAGRVTSEQRRSAAPCLSLLLLLPPQACSNLGALVQPACNCRLQDEPSSPRTAIATLRRCDALAASVAARAVWLFPASVGPARLPATSACPRPWRGGHREQHHHAMDAAPPPLQQPAFETAPCHKHRPQRLRHQSKRVDTKLFFVT